jgi:hypothetical protein
MLDNFSDEQITHALKEMEVQDNNIMRQEFIEGLRNGRPYNYRCLRIFMDFFKINHESMSEEKISGILENTGWSIISKMRDEIFNGVTDKDPGGYVSFRRFMKKLEKYS